MFDDIFEKLDKIIQARRDLKNLSNNVRLDDIENRLKQKIERLYEEEGYFVSKQFIDFPEIKTHIYAMISGLAKRANKRFNED